MNDENGMDTHPVGVTPVPVETLEGFRIWIRFDDGAEGEVDLTPYSVKPWFKPWQYRNVFENVRISPYDALVWGDDPDERVTCASAYSRCTSI